MKPYKTFTSPTIIKEDIFRTPLLPGIFTLWMGLWIIIKDLSFSLSNILFAIFGIFIVVSFCWAGYLDIGRAFHPVILTEEGIRNGKTFLRWNEIGFVKTIETKYYRDKLYKIDIELICIARDPGKYSFHTNTSSCVLIEKNLKNFEMLAKYSQGHSPVINAYLDRFFN